MMKNLPFSTKTQGRQLIMVLTMISSPPMTKLQTLSVSLGILQVKKKKKNHRSFSFGTVTYGDVLKKVKNS